MWSIVFVLAESLPFHKATQVGIEIVDESRLIINGIVRAVCQIIVDQLDSVL